MSPPRSAASGLVGVATPLGVGVGVAVKGAVASGPVSPGAGVASREHATVGSAERPTARRTRERRRSELIRESVARGERAFALALRGFLPARTPPATSVE